MGGGAGYTVTSDSGTPTQDYERRAATTGPATAVAIRSSSPGRRTPSTCRGRNTSARTRVTFPLAAYYKDLTTYIFNETIVVRLHRLRACRAPATERPTTWPTRIASARRRSRSNGSGGYIKGFEATLSLPFSHVLGRARWLRPHRERRARTSSSIKINDVETPVPGLSTKVINSTLYFEKDGFSARVSNRYARRVRRRSAGVRRDADVQQRQRRSRSSMRRSATSSSRARSKA